MNFTLFVHSRHGITSEMKCPQQQCMHGVRLPGCGCMLWLGLYVLPCLVFRVVLYARPNWLDITTNSGP